MLTVEMNDLALALLARQEGVRIVLSGVLLLLALVAIGAYVGWAQGGRAIINITLFSILAYLLTVSGGQGFVDGFNRFYTNLPKLFAFVIGRDAAVVDPFDPLIPPDMGIPLFFRIVFFLTIVIASVIYNTKAQWYSNKRAANGPFFGLLLGAFTALIWTSAASTFWSEFVTSFGNPGGWLADFFGTLPDARPLITPMIAIFFLIVFVFMLLNLPRLWKA